MNIDCQPAVAAPGDIFIRTVKMIVVPIVISTLIVGIAGVGDTGTMAIGAKTILYLN